MSEKATSGLEIDFSLVQFLKCGWELLTSIVTNIKTGFHCCVFFFCKFQCVFFLSTFSYTLQLTLLHISATAQVIFLLTWNAGGYIFVLSILFFVFLLIADDQ